MAFIRTVAMWIDHSYYGSPVELGAVDLYCSPTMTDEEVEKAKQIQIKQLHSMVKRMPHRYWREREKGRENTSLSDSSKD